MKDQDRIKLEAELAEAQAKNARLAAALDESLCGRCGGQGWYPWFDGNEVETHQQPCEKCSGTGHPQPDPPALRDLLGPVVEAFSQLPVVQFEGTPHYIIPIETCDEALTHLRAVMGKESK